MTLANQYLQNVKNAYVLDIIRIPVESLTVLNVKVMVMPLKIIKIDINQIDKTDFKEKI